MKKLNLGCEEDYKEDCLNVDIKGKYDKYVDLNLIPYPFDDNEFDVIYMINVLEHLKPTPYETLNELYRISKNGCIIHIEVPYCHSQSANSMNHIHRGFLSTSFDNALNDNECNMKGEIVSLEMVASRFGKIFPKIFKIRDIASYIFNEVYTHIRVIIKVKIELED